jgi:hypothetical protein
LDGRLAISVQRTRHFLPEEVGRMAEVTEVAEAVRRALDELGVTGEDVHWTRSPPIWSCTPRSRPPRREVS